MFSTLVLHNFLCNLQWFWNKKGFGQGLHRVSLVEYNNKSRPVTHIFSPFSPSSTRLSRATPWQNCGIFGKNSRKELRYGGTAQMIHQFSPTDNCRCAGKLQVTTLPVTTPTATNSNNFLLFVVSLLHLHYHVNSHSRSKSLDPIWH